MAHGRSDRCCVTCLTLIRIRILDSGWHALLDSPSHEEARGRFALATKFSRDLALHYILEKYIEYRNNRIVLKNSIRKSRYRRKQADLGRMPGTTIYVSEEKQ